MDYHAVPNPVSKHTGLFGLRLFCLKDMQLNKMSQGSVNTWSDFLKRSSEMDSTTAVLNPLCLCPLNTADVLKTTEVLHTADCSKSCSLHVEGKGCLFQCLMETACFSNSAITSPHTGLSLACPLHLQQDSSVSPWPWEPCGHVNPELLIIHTRTFETL